MSGNKGILAHSINSLAVMLQYNMFKLLLISLSIVASSKLVSKAYIAEMFVPNGANKVVGEELTAFVFEMH